MSHSVLAHVGTIEIGPSPGIVPSKKFVNGETIDGIKMRSISDELVAKFGPVNPQERTPGISDLTQLRLHRTTEAAFDWSVRDELGPDPYTITLDHYWGLVRGIASINQAFNIQSTFTTYMADAKGVPWIVRTTWPHFGSGGLMTDVKQVMQPHAKYAVVLEGGLYIISR